MYDKVIALLQLNNLALTIIRCTVSVVSTNHSYLNPFTVVIRQRSIEFFRQLRLVNDAHQTVN